MTMHGLPPEVRLMRNVRKGKGPDGCWIWHGSTTSNGYGAFKLSTRRLVAAHRAAYMMFIDQNLTRDQFVCHKCDVRRCVNPGHLFIGTHLDNMRDAAAKGRVRGPGRTGEVRTVNKAEAIEMRRSGVSCIEVGRRVGVSPATVWRWVNGISGRGATKL